jgi:hypothetical protein
MGFTDAGRELDFDGLWDAALGNTAMLRRDKPCKFDRAEVMRNMEGLTVGNANRKVVRLPLEDIKFLRYCWCLQGTLSALGAEVYWAEIMRPLLFEAPAAATVRPWSTG